MNRIRFEKSNEKFTDTVEYNFEIDGDTEWKEIADKFFEFLNGIGYIVMDDGIIEYAVKRKE
jgi:hypothetical protein